MAEEPNYRYQNMKEFLDRPFGRNPYKQKRDYELKYRRLRREIKVSGYTELEDSVLIHVSVPSESKKDYRYDVVIQLFPPSKEVKKEKNYDHYYLRFFSNSPGFIYNYAALYNMYGFLIEIMLRKLDPAYARKLPSIRNKDHRMCYDSSIYLACRYLTEYHLRYMTKIGQLLTVKKLNTEFFEDLKDFQSIQMDMKLMAVNAKLDKLGQEIAANTGLVKDAVKETKKETRPGGIRFVPRITASKSTGPVKVTRVKKIGSRKR